MNIYVDDNSGFCFGVKNAIDTTMKVIEEEKDKKIYTYGPLIHNKQVTEKLSQDGVEKAESLSDVKDKNSIVIIRSHGVPKEDYKILNDMGIELIDCTCPFVSKIHKIVYENYNDDYKVLIAGDKNHPEVIGINGWCNNEAVIITDEKMVDNLPFYDKICLVAQTTMASDLWDKITAKVKDKFETVKVYNTRCSATENRQRSAAKLAQNVDTMIIIGGYNSSNTRKLYEICKKKCDNTFHIETADELPYDKLNEAKNVGITAGASTPDWILKEVITKMQDFNNENLMEEYEKSFKTLHVGETIKGTVLTLNDEEVIVNIGYKADGIIKKVDLTWDIDSKPSDIINVGDEIEVQVVSINDGEGNVVLSKKLVELEKNWDKIEDAFNEKSSVLGIVKDIIKGGGIVEIFGIRAFMPASLFDLRYVSELEFFKNNKINVKIIELNRENKKVIVSRKGFLLEEREKKEKEFWDNAEEGQRVFGEVKRLTDFGAFVDIGGLDGLIHISELSWNRVNHPSEVVNSGDKVEVVILSLDKSKNKVSLGLKQTLPEPWSIIEGKYNIGDIIDVKVLRFANFGAFVELEPGIDGLVHISQISDDRITKPSQVLSIGQIIKAKIIDINIPEKKVSLSIKEAQE